MSLFECKGCEAREREIARQQSELVRMHEQLQRAVDRAFEAAAPGVTARVTPPKSHVRQMPRGPVRQPLPGYEQDVGASATEIVDEVPS